MRGMESVRVVGVCKEERLSGSPLLFFSVFFFVCLPVHFPVLETTPFLVAVGSSLSSC